MPGQKGRKRRPERNDGTAKGPEKTVAERPVTKTEKNLRERPVIEMLPELLVRALAQHDDFIMTCESDPATGTKTLHILSGRFVTPCMLRKLAGQAESQRDEGGMLISRKWA